VHWVGREQLGIGFLTPNQSLVDFHSRLYADLTSFFLQYVPSWDERHLPAIRECLARVDELDQRLLAQHELLVLRCELEAKRHALA